MSRKNYRVSNKPRENWYRGGSFVGGEPTPVTRWTDRDAIPAHRDGYEAMKDGMKNLRPAAKKKAGAKRVQCPACGSMAGVNPMGELNPHYTPGDVGITCYGV